MARAPIVGDPTNVAFGSRGQRTERLALRGGGGVQNVNPGVTRDPGISGRALSGAFDSGLGELDQIGAGLDAIGVAAQKREDEDQRIADANAATEARLDFNARLSDEFRNAQTAEAGVDDIRGHISGFGGKTKDDILSKLPENMSEVARTNLANRLKEIEATFNERGAEAQTTARQAKANDLVERVVSESVASVTADPETLDAALSSLDETLDGYTGVYTPNNLRDVERARRAQLIEAAVRGHVERGEFDKAKNLLNGGDVTEKIATDPDITEQIIQIESGGDPNARARTSSATGLGQFTKGTWIQTLKKHKPELLKGKTQAEILALRTNPDLSREMTARHADDNAKFLRSKGLQATAGNIYLAHFLGPGGAEKVLSASPDTPISKLLPPSAINANASILKGKSASEVAAFAARKMKSTFAGDISPAQRQKLTGVVNQGRTKETSRVNQVVPDHIASIRENGTGVPGFSDRAASVLTPDQLSQLQQKEQFARQFHDEMESIKNSTPAEMVQSLKELEPEAGAENFKDQQQLQNDVTAGASAELKRRETDPAGVVITQPDVNKAADNMAEVVGDPNSTPAQWVLASDAYATASLAAQTDLGIPPEGQRILTPLQAQSIVRQFNSQEEGGQNAAQLMRVLSNQWGRHWPQVLGELSKDLPGTVMVIGAMDAPGQEFAAERLAELSRIGRKALADGIEKTDLNDLGDAITSQVREEFGASLPDNFSGITTENTVKEAINLLAIDNFRNGDSVSSAATKAYENVIGKKYDFVGPGGRQFRVPKELDSRAIESGADVFLRRINTSLGKGGSTKQAEVKSPKDKPSGTGRINLPTIVLPTDTSGIGETALREEYQKHLSTGGGAWITGPNEEGLVLYDVALNAAVEFVDTDGRQKPFIVPWENLITPDSEFFSDEKIRKDGLPENIPGEPTFVPTVQ